MSIQKKPTAVILMRKDGLRAVKISNFVQPKKDDEFYDWHLSTRNRDGFLDNFVYYKGLVEGDTAYIGWYSVWEKVIPREFLGYYEKDKIRRYERGGFRFLVYFDDIYILKDAQPGDLIWESRIDETGLYIHRYAWYLDNNKKPTPSFILSSTTDPIPIQLKPGMTYRETIIDAVDNYPTLVPIGEEIWWGSHDRTYSLTPAAKEFYKQHAARIHNVTLEEISPRIIAEVAVNVSDNNQLVYDTFSERNFWSNTVLPDLAEEEDKVLSGLISKFETYTNEDFLDFRNHEKVYSDFLTHILPSLNNPNVTADSLFAILGLYSEEALSILTNSDRLKALQKMATANLRAEYGFFGGQEETIIRLVGSVAKADAAYCTTFLEGLIGDEYRVTDERNKILFRVLYDKFNDHGIPVFYRTGNLEKLMKAMHKVWEKSNMNPYTGTLDPTLGYNVTNFERFRPKYDPVTAPPVLDYTSSKDLLFYSNNMNFSFTDDDRIVAKRKVITTSSSYNGELYEDQVNITYEPFATYDIFMPVVLANSDSETTVSFYDQVVPIFFIKYADDAAHWHNVWLFVDIAIDLISIASGVGGIINAAAKLKHLKTLRALGKLGSVSNSTVLINMSKLQIGYEALDLTAGTLGAYVTYVSNSGYCNNHPEFCEKLNATLLVLELASLSFSATKARQIKRAFDDLDSELKRLDDINDPIDNAELPAVEQQRIKDIYTDIFDEINNYGNELDDLGLYSLKSEYENVFTYYEKVEFLEDFKPKTKSVKEWNAKNDALAAMDKDLIDNAGSGLTLVDEWRWMRVNMKSRHLPHRSNINVIKGLKFIRHSAVELLDEVFVGEVKQNPAGAGGGFGTTKVKGVHHKSALDNNPTKFRVHTNSSAFPVREYKGYKKRKIQGYDDIEVPNPSPPPPTIKKDSWIDKRRESTCFPDDHTYEEILIDISVAFSNKKLVEGNYRYKGTMPDGESCAFFYRNGVYTTAFPDIADKLFQ